MKVKGYIDRDGDFLVVVDGQCIQYRPENGDTIKYLEEYRKNHRCLTLSQTETHFGPLTETELDIPDE